MAKGSRLQPLARAVLRTQSDERLVRLVREGRDAAFEEIVRRYRQPLVAFAAAYTPGDPEDVVQDSLTRSWQALRESTGEMNLKPWLYTIVRNRALNARRDTRFHDELTDEVDGVRQPADIVLTNDELARVVTAVGALPDHQREALVRSALEGHTHEQIATAIGTTPGAVRQLIFRGRNTVRQGVGLLIPLPLVRLLAESGAAEATGASASAAAATSGAVLAGGSGSLATKAAVVAAVGAIVAGSGVAIERSRDGEKKPEPVKREQAAPLAESQLKSQGPTSTPIAVPVDDRSAATSSDGGGSDDGPNHDVGDDHGGGTGSGSPGPDDGASEDSSGSSGGGPGPSSSSGSSDSSDSSGHDSDDSDGSDDDNSGSSSGSSGSSGGHESSDDSSGDDGGGSGPSGSDDEIAEAPDPTDSSGPGGGDDDSLEIEDSSGSSDDSGSSGPGSAALTD